MFHLHIDDRERDLIEELKRCEISFSVKRHDLGDIQIFQEETLFAIIERKTVPDLLSSIKDGRYREQKQRLAEFKKNHPMIRVFYLLEFNGNILEEDMKFIHGVIARLLSEEFVILPVYGNVKQTVFVLSRYMEKCTNPSTHSNVDMANYKKKSCNIEDFLKHILLGIKGMGEKRCEKIIKAGYTNIPKILSDSDSIAKLIGPSLQKKVHSYLLHVFSCNHNT